MNEKSAIKRQPNQLGIDMLTTAIGKECDTNKLRSLYLERAISHEDLGKIKEAVEDYLDALELAEEPEERARIKTMIALASAKRYGLKEQALFWTMSAVEEDPNNSESLYILGVVCELCGFLNLAIAALRQALDLQPNHEAAMRNLGIYLREKGLVEESIVTLSQHIAQHPHDPIGLYELGCSLLDSVDLDGQREQAKQHFERALQENPSDLLQTIIERKLTDLG